MTRGAPVKVFVAERGNGFMTDIAGMIAEAAGVHRPTAVCTDDLPQADGSINLVVAPHEFFELNDASTPELQRAAAASICIGTEQPETPWFHLAADACRRGLLTLDINDVGVEALRAHSIPAERLRLGAVPMMDYRLREPSSAIADQSAPTRESASGRPTDVLFMGGLDDHRGRVLAELAPQLMDRSSDLRLFRFDQPIGAHTPGVVFGTEKYDLLASAKILLNIHRDHPDVEGPRAEPYFEWVRMIEAMANGCAVLTEPSVGYEPLVDGQHFVAADNLDEALADLLGDDSRRNEIAEAGHRMVTETLDLNSTIGPLLDHIEADILPSLERHVESERYGRGTWRFHGEVANPVNRLDVFRPYRTLQQTAKAMAMAENGTLRHLDQLKCVLANGTTQHISRRESPAYRKATPDVSVIVTLYNYADVVTETLDSLAESPGVEIEIIVVDDHATDDSRAVVDAFIDQHPTLAVLRVGKDANEGLAAARNTGFGEARAKFVMVMDADNHAYPTCIARLRETLLEDPSASAAYAILEDFGDQRNIRSAIDWDPRRLCGANYIDAQAMWRATAWRELGGYRDDDEFVFGWEDWDLWLRLAERGGHATLRREILGRYRVRHGSMISLTNLATDDAIEAMRLRYPSLPWPT
jgi:GT2 family glycosyltransferase